ncbi:MAG: primosomal protein N' [Pseudomonadota bacterium]
MTDEARDLSSAQAADVLLPLALDGAYSYLVPEDVMVQPGCYVQVPLGPQMRIGIVWGEPKPAMDCDKPERLREIAHVYDVQDAPPLPDLNRKFIDWVAAYTMSPPGQVMRMTLRVPAALEPPPVRHGYRANGFKPERLTPQRARVLEVAGEGPAWTGSDLASAAGVSSAVVKGLSDAGALEKIALPAHAPFAPPLPKANPVTLSGDQEAAAKVLRRAVIARDFSVTLIDGVTGSGKTEVYFEAVAAAVSAGKQVLILLPEIALTGQFIARVEARFGAPPAGWHSGMKPRERERVWRGVAHGHAKIVVGARSALFLPWANLGLIVVDEEHESAYKQEDGVRYHARDMAVVLAALGKFPLVLASATPSLESLVNVDRGRYNLVCLPDRHGRAVLPKIDLVDMRETPAERGTWLSPPLVHAVAETLKAGDQAMLFLNRRGYAPLTLCRSCGYRFECPNCQAWLVEHRFRRQLVCHHCGYTARIPNACPACGTEDALVPCGPGVERVAEEALARFPDARIAILSSDMIYGSDSLRQVLAEIVAGEHNLIIGTQLVAKGHHFPQLTLAGVVDADIGLENGDPRAGERTWQLLAQVSGRAGRGEKPGRAIVQTHMPEHNLMQALVAGDRDGYLAHEKHLRERMDLPPYGRLTGLIISAASMADAERFARELAMRAPPAEGVRVLGPAPAPLAMVRGRHRVRFLVKSQRDVNIQAFLAAWLDGVKPKGSVRLAVDVDAYSFL